MTFSSILQSLPDLFSSGEKIIDAGVWGALGVGIAAGFRHLTGKNKTQSQSDQVFASNLLTRTGVLEKTIERLHREHEIKDELHDKEIAFRRHEAQNAKTCFTYLMMLVKRIKDPPAELVSIITDIELMRSETLRREDLERASLEEFEKAMKSIPLDR